jgi:hypothetical protein
VPKVRITLRVLLEGDDERLDADIAGERTAKQIVETAGLRAPAGLSIDRLLMPFNLNGELNPLAVVVSLRLDPYP